MSKKTKTPVILLEYYKPNKNKQGPMSYNNIHHKMFLSKTIKTWIEEQKSEDTTSIILQTTLETIMEYERDAFFADKQKENKKNGYYNRMAKMISGVFDVKIPRDRMGIFKPLILEIVKKDNKKLNELAFSLYSKGMTTRDINKVLEETYSFNVSPQYISNITRSMQKAREEWMKRKLDDQYYVIYIDAIHLPLRRETVENEAIYIVMGLNKELKREILGIYSIPQESASGWREVLEDLKNRGLKDTALFVADGLKALETSVSDVFPKSRFQKCVTHLKRNVLRKARAKDRKEISKDLSFVFDMNLLSDTYSKALKRLDAFIEKWSRRYPNIKGVFNEGVKRYYFTYLDFPFEIRRMIYTTNWIERLNKDVRKTLKNRNSMPNEDSALNLIWSSLMNTEANTYTYPITAFSSSKVELEEMLSTGEQTQKS